MKYPYYLMMPGQTKSKTFPTLLDAIRARTAAYAYARTHKKKFACTLIDTRLHVKYVCDGYTPNYEPVYVKWARNKAGRYPDFDALTRLKPEQTLVIEFLKLSQLRECKQRIANFCHAHGWLVLFTEHERNAAIGLLLKVYRIPFKVTRYGIKPIESKLHQIPWRLFKVDDFMVIPIPNFYLKFVDVVQNSIHSYAKRSKKKFLTRRNMDRLEVTRIE